MHLVLTACTNRKRVPAPADLRAESLGRGLLPALADDWVARLTDSTERVAARRLYAGRGFQEAVAAAAHLYADLAIVSAGLGVVQADKGVPPYALSVVEGSADNVLARATDAAEPRDWWAELAPRSPFGEPLSEKIAGTQGIVIAALSEAYLAMVADDLKALPICDAARLRIVTRAPLERVEPALRDRVMPYDDRLDGPDSTDRGTRGDFAARAGRHFARDVVAKDPSGDAEAHATAVSAILAGWREAPAFERARHDDDTLLEIIREHWEKAGGQSARLLRVLRDDLNIACEQGRFVGLKKRLRAERAAA